MNLIVNYSSDSDEEPSETTQNKSENETIQPPRRLPLPDCLVNSLKREEVVDDPLQNDGRIRSFPHQRGNWASLIYVPFERGEEMIILCERLAKGVEECECVIKPISSPHVSLTRTFILLYHWIQEFVSTVKTSVATYPSFRLEFGDLDVYLNDEGTRTFLGLTVSTGYNRLADIVRSVDTCLNQYNLKPFYEEGKFHMSVCWCLGDKCDVLLAALPRLRKILQSFFIDYPESSFVDVSYVECKIGNRIYRLDLVSL